MRLGLLFFFTFCGYPIVLLAQNNYLFHHLTLKDGLESEFVQSVFQDSKGYYWVGTTSGLQKFDGYSFSKPLKAGKDLLSSSTVTETRDGTLWISNGSSLYRYNRANEQFIALTPKGEKPIMNLRVIQDIAGNIWLLNDKALYKYDLIAKKLVNWLKLPASSPALTAGAIAFKKEASLIWLQNGTTLYTISPGKKRIIKEEKMPFQAAQLWTDGDYLWLSL